MRNAISRRTILGSIGTASASLLLSRIAFAAASERMDRVTALIDEYASKKKVAGAVAVVGTHESPKIVSGHIALSGEWSCKR